ncbi:hypothetical protein DESUT3_18920 [Desulfuromonas versatilis]|uniref:Lipoprotein n=1 Tax=Desulfuromonas versatilis TaxID=2802975 RepID=A0ABN6DXH1_9BACT|nr:hypothetical protein [Desulfuromonas versatilis]BCR04823.1 hypothetical protein DESUT3_18920 [Desulfuromonas versatilis]
MALTRLQMAVLALFLVVGCTAAPPRVDRTVDVGSGLKLGLALPSERWVVQSTVPDFLVEERAEHLEHELAEKGKQVSREDLLNLSRKRLSANELFVFNPQTRAVLEVDFSPLDKGESAPSRGTVANSARFAGESLSQEEGVTQASADVAKTRVYGAMAAYRLDAAYQHHGHSTRFVGVVGFADPCWFYLYYTDPLADAADLQEMDSLLRNLLVEGGKVK